MIGQYDAAVIEQKNGKPHVVDRMDRQRARIIPEWFEGGILPRKELRRSQRLPSGSISTVIRLSPWR